MAGRQGFEPRLHGPEPRVLPLNDLPARGASDAGTSHYSGRKPRCLASQLSRWVFLRLLGLTYLAAFASLTPQIIGLVGADGLLPAAEYLERAKKFYGADAYMFLPTLGWISASDGVLLGLCWGGIVLSALAVVGIAPVPTFWLLWVFYLSLTVLGQTFLSFQWDVLLLETGLLAGLYAPLGWWPVLGRDAQAPALIRWLLWLLLFKLMFLSGITKLVSGDETWWGLTALTFSLPDAAAPGVVELVPASCAGLVAHGIDHDDVRGRARRTLRRACALTISKGESNGVRAAVSLPGRDRGDWQLRVLQPVDGRALYRPSR